MATKDLQIEPHKVTFRGEVRDDVSIYETSYGLWVYFRGGEIALL